MHNIYLILTVQINIKWLNFRLKIKLNLRNYFKIIKKVSDNNFHHHFKVLLIGNNNIPAARIIDRKIKYNIELGSHYIVPCTILDFYI